MVSEKLRYWDYKIMCKGIVCVFLYFVVIYLDVSVLYIQVLLYLMDVNCCVLGKKLN